MLELLLALEDAGIFKVVANKDKIDIAYLGKGPDDELKKQIVELKPMLLRFLKKPCQLPPTPKGFKCKELSL